MRMPSLTTTTRKSREKKLIHVESVEGHTSSRFPLKVKRPFLLWLENFFISTFVVASRAVWEKREGRNVVVRTGDFFPFQVEGKSVQEFVWNSPFAAKRIDVVSVVSFGRRALIYRQAHSDATTEIATDGRRGRWWFRQAANSYKYHAR